MGDNDWYFPNNITKNVFLLVWILSTYPTQILKSNRNYLKKKGWELGRTWLAEYNTIKSMLVIAMKIWHLALATFWKQYCTAH